MSQSLLSFLCLCVLDEELYKEIVSDTKCNLCSE